MPLLAQEKGDGPKGESGPAAAGCRQQSGFYLLLGGASAQAWSLSAPGWASGGSARRRSRAWPASRKWPETSRRAMIIAAALIEGVTFFALIVCWILK